MALPISSIINNQVKSILNIQTDWVKYQRRNSGLYGKAAGDIPGALNTDSIYDHLGIYDSTWEQPTPFGRSCYWTGDAEYLGEATQASIEAIADLAITGGHRRYTYSDNTVYPNSLLILDEETPDRHQLGSAYWAQRIQWAKERQPSLKIGIYGVPWSIGHNHDWIYTNQEQALIDFIATFENRRDEGDASDFIIWDGELLGDSEYYIERDIVVRSIFVEAARTVWPEKVMISFVFGYFNQGNPVVKITGSKLDRYIEHLRNTWDGVAVWGAWQWNSDLTAALLIPNNTIRLRKRTWASDSDGSY